MKMLFVDMITGITINIAYIVYSLMKINSDGQQLHEYEQYGQPPFYVPTVYLKIVFSSSFL